MAIANPVTDIAAIIDTIKLNLFNGTINAIASCDKTIAYCCHSQHSSAIGDNLLLLQFSASMKDNCSFCFGAIDPCDRLTFFVSTWITSRRRYYTNRTAIFPINCLLG
jgi:hypothetical protein